MPTHLPSPTQQTRQGTFLPQSSSGLLSSARPRLDTNNNTNTDSNTNTSTTATQVLSVNNIPPRTMASTAVPSKGNPALRRTITSTTCDSDSAPSTVVASPSDSPRPSASSTSLSSMSSLDAIKDNKVSYGKLIDTYGNEFEVPDYTIKDIRDAIPKHCFERDGVKGMGYVLRDMAYLATTFYLFHNYVTPEYVPSYPLRFALWGLYTAMQGLFATGLWVLAHECGHQAFSPSKLYNNVVGWVLHSALLVPYFSWQMSHSKHHKATGHLERDMVFVPRTREQQATRLGKMVHELSELTEETPIYTLLMLLGQQLIGWPNYLMTNVTGHNYHERQREGRGKGKHNGFGGGVNHFDPRTPLYENKDAHLVILSDIGVGLTALALYFLVQKFGWTNMLVWYFIPYLWVNHWLGECSPFCFSVPLFRGSSRSWARTFVRSFVNR